MNILQASKPMQAVARPGFSGDSALTGLNAAAKRVLDVVLALVGLTLGAPVLLFIGAVLWLESPRQIVFSQQRLGRHGRLFTLYKFRKFPVYWGNRGPSVTVANDARMTRFGALLERTKLDELPQLWNILRGDMSFVGPRPESPKFAHLFAGDFRRLLDYAPGLFGPAQIVSRNESDLYPVDEDPEVFYQRVLFAIKAKEDIAYYPRATCLSDCSWILRGLWVSVAGAFHWQRLARNNGKLMLVDALSVAVAWLLANLCRFLGLPGGSDLESFALGFVVLPPLLVFAMLVGRCYRYPKRFFSHADALRLVVTVSFAWLLAFLLLLGHVRNVSLYLAPMGWFVLLPLLLFPRTYFRLRAEGAARCSSESPRILVYGCAAAGIALANWIKSASLGTSLAGFLDDNAEFRGQVIHGVRVLGSERDLATIGQVKNINEIWITFVPTAKKRRRLHDICGREGIKLVVMLEQEPFCRFLPYRGDRDLLKAKLKTQVVGVD